MNRAFFLIFGGLVLVLGLVNGAIMQKEVRLADGRTIYLEHAPVDPRSLMQGDYMILNYGINRDSKVLEAVKGQAARGAFVLKMDERGVGTFARVDDGETGLAPDEVRLKYRLKRRGVKTATESFFFQEGLGQEFEAAKYSELRVSADGTSILVGLRDMDLGVLGEEDLNGR
jgi:uncharacterized membrane-anchored protein